jgi:hypothetical protein
VQSYSPPSSQVGEWRRLTRCCCEMSASASRRDSTDCSLARSDIRTNQTVSYGTAVLGWRFFRHFVPGYDRTVPPGHFSNAEAIVFVEDASTEEVPEGYKTLERPVASDGTGRAGLFLKAVTTRCGFLGHHRWVYRPNRYVYTKGANVTPCIGFWCRMESTNMSSVVLTCSSGDYPIVAARSSAHIARNASGKATLATLPLASPDC